MADQIILAWTVEVANSSFGPAEASAALAAVALYDNTVTDPVLGQAFGLTVEDDATVSGPTSATRTLTLNMTNTFNPAPPAFPCRPRTSTPPVLPYPLREAVTLPGSFFVTLGSASVPTTETQLPSLSVGDMIQFLSQEGVFYEVLAVTATTVTLTTPYTGITGNTPAFKEIPAPVVFAAVYSTSDLDTDGVATVPPIAAGCGAQVVEITYLDSTGAGPFGAVVSLTGRRPAAVTLDVGSIDIAEIIEFEIDTAGSFDNSVGQITLCALESALPPIPSNATPEDFETLTDEAQMLISRHLAYLPPSFLAVTQQGASYPQLAGDFLVTTDSPSVPTTEDQSAVLAGGDTIQFASQTDKIYTVSTVSPKIVILTEAYTGFDDTDHVIGTKVINKRTGAFITTPTAAAPPTNAELSVPLGQYLEEQVAMPPPGPPLQPATITPPTFLSDLFTQVISRALAVPVTAEPITFV